MKHTSIVVKLQVEGFHSWPAAKELLPSVAFLSDRHRHIFFITCKKNVSHSDRDVEIILFKREILQYLKTRYSSSEHEIVCEFGSMSCEMIASELMNYFSLNYCEVLEDNENGAYVEPMSFMGKSLTFVCGYPCSGKGHYIKNKLIPTWTISVSSIVRELISTNAQSIISTPTIDQYNESVKLDSQITEQIKQRVYSKFVQNYWNIAIDGIRQPSILEKMIEWCDMHKISYKVVWLISLPQVCRERFEKRSKSIESKLTYDEILQMNQAMGIEELSSLISQKEKEELGMVYKKYSTIYYA